MPVDAPKVERREMTTYNLPQTAALLDTARGEQVFIPTLLAELCGIRRGEIAALRWRNVDFDTAQISVVASVEQMNGGVRLKETKNSRARTVAMCRRLAKNSAPIGSGRPRTCSNWETGLTDDNFVAALADGSPMQPTSSPTNGGAFETTNLPVYGCRDLRHAHGTQMLSSGIHPKVASERLGHSRVGTTLDLYSHVLPGIQEDAAARMDAALKAAQKRA